MNFQSCCNPFDFNSPGYKAYLGYLLMEHAHANPVMQAFVIIMLNQSSVDLARGKFYVYSVLYRQWCT